MKIEVATPQLSFEILAENAVYTRYSATMWTERFGSGQEDVRDENLIKELEDAFQAYHKEQNESADWQKFEELFNKYTGNISDPTNDLTQKMP